jgi:hypothetical protein
MITISSMIGVLLLLNTASAKDAIDAAAMENWRQANATEKESQSIDPCLLLSPKVMINDGQGETRIWLEMTNKALVLKTKSDIDTAFNDIGIQVDDKGFIPLDRVDNDVDVVFEKSITAITPQFIHGQNVNLQLRFWPTWPSKGVQTAKFSLLGFTKAYKNLAEQCRPNEIESKPKKSKSESKPEQDQSEKDQKETKDQNDESAVKR